MTPTPYWFDTAVMPHFAAPGRDHDVDVIIVGAGITGITAAHLLKRAGKTVALIERDRCAAVDTGHTTAHLTSVIDTRLTQLEKAFGRDATKLVWEAGSAAIDQIVSLIRAHDITCDFRWVPGYLHQPLRGHSGMNAAELSDEARLALELGIAAEFVDDVPFFGVAGVKFSHQAIFHPRKYLAALARLIPGNGSHVFEQAEVRAVEADPLAVHVGQHRISGKYIVFATHNPLMGNASLVPSTLFQTKLALYTSYAISAEIPAGIIPVASYWDTSNPYYYLRIDPGNGHDRAIFGGEDHKTGQETDPNARYLRLEECFRKFFPDADVDHRWSGQVIETNDGLPYIGETAERQFVATGFGGNGMTLGTLGGMMAVDAVIRRKNPWQELFDVHRRKLAGGTWKFLKENKDYPYYLVRDWLAGTEGSSAAEVGRNEGKLISLGGRKVAAYRDAQGKLSLCSPVCTHLKCIVGWNPAEKTWDCPCHGSRFKPTGEVISGPAEEPLAKIVDPATTAGQ